MDIETRLIALLSSSIFGMLSTFSRDDQALFCTGKMKLSHMRKNAVFVRLPLYEQQEFFNEYQSVKWK